jgi:hypothetical protein
VGSRKFPTALTATATRVYARHVSQSDWTRRMSFVATALGIVTAVITIVGWIASQSFEQALKIALYVAGDLYFLAFFVYFVYAVYIAIRYPERRDWRCLGPSRSLSAEFALRAPEGVPYLLRHANPARLDATRVTLSDTGPQTLVYRCLTATSSRLASIATAACASA